VELAALLGGQRREELALNLGRGCLGASEAPGSFGSQLDHLAAPIAGVAAARDQAVVLELVEQGDEVRRVDSKGAGELAAVRGPALLEAVEDRELVAVHLERF